MKNLIAAVAISLSASGAYAQEALWGQAPVVSPQLNPDGTVTFRIEAPKASDVKMTGDLLPVIKIKPEGYPDSITVRPPAIMHRNPDGIWEYTTPQPLDPELYTYSFIVDSMRTIDMANPYVIRDVSTLNSLLSVPGNRASLYMPRAVPHGNVAKVWYDSDSLGRERRLTIYTPPAYTDDTDRSYPVLYLLHGMGGDENAWTELGRAQHILDNLIARGLAEHMIVVMPNGNVSQSAAPGETAEGLRVPTLQLPQTMDGTFEEVFPEIVAYVDSNYRTIPDKAHRAVAGLSMGGFHTLHLARLYPDFADYLGLFSPKIYPFEGTESMVYADFDSRLAQVFAKKPTLVWLGIGKMDFLYDENAGFRHKLDASGYPYTYYESDGGHTWRNWRIYLTEFLPLLFR